MQGSAANKLPYIFYALAVAFLGFVAGALVTVAGVFPSNHIRDAYRAGTALYDKYTRQQDPFQTDLWSKARTGQRGVSLFDPDRAHVGYTLYTAGDDAKALLISMDGQALHEWRRPFSTVWDKSAAVHAPVPDTNVFFNKAHVFPNGDLLVIYIGVGDSPYGYGMAKLDKHSNIIWKNLAQFHHDFAVGDDGRIYGLTHQYRKTPLEGADQFEPPFLDDYLVILSADGETQRNISLLDAVNRSDFRRYLWRVPYYSMEDPLHTNAVDLLSEADAERLRTKLPMAAKGQVLLSFRELAGGSIALLDTEQEKVVWASRGPWLAQHDPDILPNGNVMVFDNWGHFGSGGKSRVVEVDPATGGIQWVYAGDEEHPLDSAIRSSQQPLPSGSVLITESNGGRLLEVTRDGEIVWEYINPVREGNDDELVSVVCWAQRIDPMSLAADFRAGFAKSIVNTKEVSTR